VKLKLFAFILVYNFITAQVPTFKLLSDEDGLKANAVYDICKDSRGLFWLATDNGLFRFDGTNFIPIPFELQKYKNVAIRKLKIYDNELFVIYENEGCISINLDSDKFDVLTTEKIADICKIQKKLWILLDNGKLQKLGNQRTKDIYDFNVTDLGYSSLINYKGTLNIAIPEKGFYTLTNNSIKALCKYNLGGYNERFIVLNDHLFYIGTSEILGLSKNTSKIVQSIKNSKNKINGRITDLEYINDSTAYFLSSRKRLFKISNNIISEITLPYHDLDLIKILIYNPNKIYVCTNQGLLKINTASIVKNKSFIDVQKSNQALNRVRRKIFHYKKNIYLFGYKNFLTDSSYTHFKNLKALNFSVYDAVLVDGIFFLATEGSGLQCYELKHNICRSIPLAKDIPDNMFCTIEKSSDEKEIYIGGFGCLYNLKLKDEKATKIEIPDKNKLVLSILENSTNNNILAGTENGIVLINNNNKKKLKSTFINKNLAGKRISAMLFDKKRNLIWIGHEKGVDIIDTKNYKIKRRLHSDLFVNSKVASLEQDYKGNIWISTFSEIIGYNYELRKIVRFTKKNGLINREFNYKSSEVLNTNEVIFGGLNGYDIINTTYDFFKKNTHKGIVTGYSLISKNKTEYLEFRDKKKSIKFNGDTSYIKIYISPSTYTSNNYQIEYRLNKENWIELSNKSFLELVNIPYDKFELEFRAFDPYGSTILFDPVFIEITTSFFKTKTFMFILFSFITLILFLVFKYKISLEKKDNLMRTKIAMDLHDDIGSVVSRLKILSQTNNNITGELRNNIISNLDYLSFNLNNYIHTIDSKDKSILELYDEIIELYSKSLSHLDIIFNFKISYEKELYISSGFFKDLKFSLFEIINNCIKHSQAKELSLDFKITKEGFNITVKDDGILDSIANLKGKGNGISNLKKRIQRNNAAIFFTITSTHGLSIKIDFLKNKI